MGEALNKFVEQARHLSETFDSHTVFSIGGWDISQYTLYMFFILALVLMVVLIGGRKLQLVPKNKFLNTVEYGYDFVNTSIGQDVIGEGFKKHIPFLCTLFFFILIANVVGLIPGAKATTGTISITWALAAISFVYFNFYGLKTLGVFGYIKSLVPSGVPAPMVPIIWFLEFFSMVIRVLDAGCSSLRQHAGRPYGPGRVFFGNHRVPAAGCFQHGLRYRAACCRMVRFAGPHVCDGVPGGVPSGVRVHHPVRFLHRHGGSSPLMCGPAAQAATCSVWHHS